MPDGLTLEELDRLDALAQKKALTLDEIDELADLRSRGQGPSQEKQGTISDEPAAGSALASMDLPQNQGLTGSPYVKRYDQFQHKDVPAPKDGAVRMVERMVAPKPGERGTVKGKLKEMVSAPAVTVLRGLMDQQELVEQGKGGSFDKGLATGFRVAGGAIGSGALVNTGIQVARGASENADQFMAQVDRGQEVVGQKVQDWTGSEAAGSFAENTIMDIAEGALGQAAGGDGLALPRLRAEDGSPSTPSSKSPTLRELNNRIRENLNRDKTVHPTIDRVVGKTLLASGNEIGRVKLSDILKDRDIQAEGITKYNSRDIVTYLKNHATARFQILGVLLEKPFEASESRPPESGKGDLTLKEAPEGSVNLSELRTIHDLSADDISAAWEEIVDSRASVDVSGGINLKGRKGKAVPTQTVGEGPQRYGLGEMATPDETPKVSLNLKGKGSRKSTSASIPEVLRHLSDDQFQAIYEIKTAQEMRTEGTEVRQMTEEVLGASAPPVRKDPVVKVGQKIDPSRLRLPGRRPAEAPKPVAEKAPVADIVKPVVEVEARRLSPIESLAADADKLPSGLAQDVRKADRMLNEFPAYDDPPEVKKRAWDRIAARQKAASDLAEREGISWDEAYDRLLDSQPEVTNKLPSIPDAEWAATQPRKKHVYRGMEPAEFGSTVGSGRDVESMWAGNQTEGTSFARASDASDAGGYALWGDSARSLDSPRKYGYVVEAKRSAVHSTDNGMLDPGEILGTGPTPFADVTRVWRVEGAPSADGRIDIRWTEIPKEQWAGLDKDTPREPSPWDNEVTNVIQTENGNIVEVSTPKPPASLAVQDIIDQLGERRLETRETPGEPARFLDLVRHPLGDIEVAWNAEDGILWASWVDEAPTTLMLPEETVAPVDPLTRIEELFKVMNLKITDEMVDRLMNDDAFLQETLANTEAAYASRFQDEILAAPGEGEAAVRPEIDAGKMAKLGEANPNAVPVVPTLSAPVGEVSTMARKGGKKATKIIDAEEQFENYQGGTKSKGGAAALRKLAVESGLDALGYPQELINQFLSPKISPAGGAVAAQIIEGKIPPKKGMKLLEKSNAEYAERRAVRAQIIAALPDLGVDLSAGTDLKAVNKAMQSIMLRAEEFKALAAAIKNRVPDATTGDIAYVTTGRDKVTKVMREIAGSGLGAAWDMAKNLLQRWSDGKTFAAIEQAIQSELRAAGVESEVLAKYPDILKDQDGRPIVYYHGTGYAFDKLDPSVGRSGILNSANEKGITYYSEAEPEMALTYAPQRASIFGGDKFSPNAYIRRAYVRAKNPLILKYGDWWDFGKEAQRNGMSVAAYAKSKGYDAVKLEGVWRSGPWAASGANDRSHGDHPGILAIFSPEQEVLISAESLKDVPAKEGKKVATKPGLELKDVGDPGTIELRSGISPGDVDKALRSLFGGLQSAYEKMMSKFFQGSKTSNAVEADLVRIATEFEESVARAEIRAAELAANSQWDTAALEQIDQVKKAIAPLAGQVNAPEIRDQILPGSDLFSPKAMAKAGVAAAGFGALGGAVGGPVGAVGGAILGLGRRGFVTSLINSESPLLRKLGSAVSQAEGAVHLLRNQDRTIVGAARSLGVEGQNRVAKFLDGQDVALNDAEALVATLIRAHSDAKHKMNNIARVASGKDPIAYRENWMPHLNKDFSGLHADIARGNADYMSVYNPHANSRQINEPWNPEVHLSLADSLEMVYPAFNRDTIWTPVLDMAEALTGSDKKKGVLPGLTADYIRRELRILSGRDQALLDRALDIFGDKVTVPALTQLAETFLRKGPHEARAMGIRGRENVSDFIEAVSNTVNYVAKLGMSPMTVAVNTLGTYSTILPQVDLPNFTQALRDYARVGQVWEQVGRLGGGVAAIGAGLGVTAATANPVAGMGAAMGAYAATSIAGQTLTNILKSETSPLAQEMARVRDMVLGDPEYLETLYQHRAHVMEKAWQKFTDSKFVLGDFRASERHGLGFAAWAGWLQAKKELGPDAGDMELANRARQIVDKSLIGSTKGRKPFVGKELGAVGRTMVPFIDYSTKYLDMGVDTLANAVQAAASFHRQGLKSEAAKALGRASTAAILGMSVMLAAQQAGIDATKMITAVPNVAMAPAVKAIGASIEAAKDVPGTGPNSPEAFWESYLKVVAYDRMKDLVTAENVSQQRGTFLNQQGEPGSVEATPKERLLRGLGLRSTEAAAKDAENRGWGSLSSNVKNAREQAVKKAARAQKKASDTRDPADQAEANKLIQEAFLGSYEGTPFWADSETSTAAESFEASLKAQLGNLYTTTDEKIYKGAPASVKQKIDLKPK